MHVIAYEHLVGFPRESKQHLDAVCMCGRLQRGVQPARSRLCVVHVRRDGIQPAARRSASAPRHASVVCAVSSELRACGGLHLAAVSRARPALSSYTMATSRAQPLQGVIRTVNRNVTFNLIRFFVQHKLL